VKKEEERKAADEWGIQRRELCNQRKGQERVQKHVYRESFIKRKGKYQENNQFELSIER